MTEKGFKVFINIYQKHIKQLNFKDTLINIYMCV